MADRYIPGVPCWIDTTQPDPDAAMAFYGGLFGWEFEDVLPRDAPGRYAIAKLPGGDVGGVGSQPDGPPIALWNTYVWVDDADETAAKARDAGGTIVMEPMDVFEAGRVAVFTDPEGATIAAWQPRNRRGSQVVNEHGSLNFNNLNTRDMQAAAAFYGAVFGWDLIDVGGSGMWALPAYGDFLEARTPGTRKGMEEMGAPDRFIEVVASAVAIPDDQPDTPPHWSLTFGTDDADATAAKATELRDPQGATFTASKFVPENKDLAT
jgi:predicted enzyme related to lactoylglutathione lyase